MVVDASRAGHPLAHTVGDVGRGVLGVDAEGDELCDGAHIGQRAVRIPLVGGGCGGRCACSRGQRLVVGVSPGLQCGVWVVAHPVRARAEIVAMRVGGSLQPMGRSAFLPCRRR